MVDRPHFVLADNKFFTMISRYKKYCLVAILHEFFISFHFSDIIYGEKQQVNYCTFLVEWSLVFFCSRSVKLKD